MPIGVFFFQTAGESFAVDTYTKKNGRKKIPNR
jgi:hypothetical protein